MEKKSYGCTLKNPLKSSYFPATTDSIIRELGSQQSFQIFLAALSFLRKVQMDKRFSEFSVRQFEHLGVSFGYINRG